MSHTRTNELVGRLRLPENLCGFRILVVLRGFYGNARNKACESNEADRYHAMAAPHRAIAERGHAPEGVAHEVEQTKRRDVAVVAAVPSGGAAIAALVRRHHVKAGGRQRPHH